MTFISIQEKIGIPKYKQIVTSIENAISSGELKKGDQLPSISSIKNKHILSRDTVMTAINELKVRGIVHTIAGKGSYILSEDIEVSQKVFLLFDELNTFKEDLYNSFLNNLGSNIKVDIFFHHFNFDIFCKLIYDNIGDYSHYIIMPANLKNTNLVLEKLPKNKVYILDQTHIELSGYPTIFQNFEKDIFQNLSKGLHLIKKYTKLILLFDSQKQPQGMHNGFLLFCKKNAIEFEIINNLEGRFIRHGEVYLIPDDRNLIRIIKKIREEKFVLAKDIGIISYNDNLLKEIVEGGITTISTDFNKMGERLAQMIINKEQLKIENPNSLIIRNSL